MSQETNQFDHNVDHEVNIDSSSTSKTTNEEKKYAFNQAEVNQGAQFYESQKESDENADSAGNHDGVYVNHLHNETAGQGSAKDTYSKEYTNESGNRKPGAMFGMFGEPQKLPAIQTDEDARNVYYGINQPYYKKVYKQYKEGKKISWNWSAFVFQSHWFFSRKMYTIGTFYSAMMAVILVSMNQIKENINNPSIQPMAYTWILVFLGLWIATGMFANYIYMAHMENKIIYPSDNKMDNKKLAQVIVIRGGFSVYGVIISLMVSNLLVPLVQYIATLM